MKSRILIAAASGALLMSTAAAAQVQNQQGDIFSQLLGSIFGNNQQASEQTLESDWNQGQRPFEQRRGRLEERIDTAVRDGSMSRTEADQVRREYDDIVRLEGQYAANGSVSPQQRTELRTRYRALTQRVRNQGFGEGTSQGGYQNDGRWQPLSTRNGEFEQRISIGLQNRSISQGEATRLRADWRALAQVEAGYMRNGIDAREQADLSSRYNAIDTRLGGNIGGGYGNDRNTARWRQMETRLATAERNGGINRNDAVQMRAQLSDLARLDAAYAASGYSADERSYLTRRYGELDSAMGNNRR